MEHITTTTVLEMYFGEGCNTEKATDEVLRGEQEYLVCGFCGAPADEGEVYCFCCGEYALGNLQ